MQETVTKPETGSDDFKLELNKIKKRKLKNGEEDYPRYEFRTVEEIFNTLTPENMNRFFKALKDAMSVAVHMRELVTIMAKENAKKEGVELTIKGSDAIKMPSFTWIDD